MQMHTHAARRRLRVGGGVADSLRVSSVAVAVAVVVLFVCAGTLVISHFYKVTRSANVLCVCCVPPTTTK